jgi:hypothetical protein
MVTLQAPYDLIQATILLPSANLGDTISPQIKVNIRNSMSGKIYSTIKTNSRYKLEMDFSLTNAKARELDMFIQYYNSLPWRLYDWNDTLYKVYLTTNPVSLTPVGLNSVNARLEFEGFKIV